MKQNKENNNEERKAEHAGELKSSLVKRLNRIEGQIRGIKKMVEEDVYCDEILHQIMSAKASLDGVSKELLKAHINSCIVRQIKEGKEEVVDELMVTIKKMIK
jgi:DNA-binding FrmR family transcriptional regulator